MGSNPSDQGDYEGEVFNQFNDNVPSDENAVTRDFNVAVSDSQSSRRTNKYKNKQGRKVTSVNVVGHGDNNYLTEGDFSEYTSDDIEIEILATEAGHASRVYLIAYSVGLTLGIFTILLRVIPSIWQRTILIRNQFIVVKSSSTFIKESNVRNSSSENMVIEMRPLTEPINSSNSTESASSRDNSPSAWTPASVPTVSGDLVRVSVPMLTTFGLSPKAPRDRRPFLAGTFFTDGPEEESNDCIRNGNTNCVVMVQVH